MERQLIASLVGYVFLLWFSSLPCVIRKKRKAVFCLRSRVSGGLGERPEVVATGGLQMPVF